MQFLTLNQFIGNAADAARASAATGADFNDSLRSINAQMMQEQQLEEQRRAAQMAAMQPTEEQRKAERMALLDLMHRNR